MSLDSSPSDKRKSFLIATLIYGVLLLIMFFIRFWPPSDEELLALAGGGGGGGVTVNFGDTDFGSGNNFDSKELDVKNNTKQVASQEAPLEDIISQDDEADKTDAVIPKHEPIKNPKTLIKPEVTKPVEVKKPMVKKVDDALANIIHGNKKEGDGNDDVQGNKGKKNGDKNSKNYDGDGLGNGKYGNSFYGNGDGDGIGINSGNGNSWGLKGRKLASNNPKPQTCNEYGTVVVKIYVNQQGNVFKAERAQGTTNTDPCLVNPAIETAKTFKWLPDANAPETQIGFIVVNFKIGN
jgi:hypothetical protein